MTHAFISTPITRLFGIKHPLLLGGMHWITTSSLVAAVVNEGAMAFITPRSFESLNEYRQDLRRCADLTNGLPFGVNLTISNREKFNRDVPAWIDIALEEGVRHFESAGSSPEALVDPIHSGKAILLHKCPSVRHALTAERLGVDAVALVGLEEGGHPGANKLSAFVNGAFALQRLKIPLVIGGGIGCGGQIAGALAMGAGGVVVGSIFMTASEAKVHHALKEKIASLDEHGSMTVLGSLNNTQRVMVNETALEVARIESEGAKDYSDFGDLILSSRTIAQVYKSGDVEAGLVCLGPAAGFANPIEPAGDIVNRLMTEAIHATQSFTTSLKLG